MQFVDRALTPVLIGPSCGTAEAVPFQNRFVGWLDGF
jgi:hypothetical protein